MKWVLLWLVLAEGYLPQIRDYLLLRDYPSAESVCKEALQKMTHSEAVTKLLIEAYAKQGKEKEMLKSWKALYAESPQEALDHDLLEKMAWGVIEKGHKSSTPLVRLFAMLAAVFSQDIQGVHLLARELKSEHSGIRAIALQLSSMLGDEMLKAHVAKLFAQERVFDVRLAAIKAVGQLRIKELQGALEKLASNEKATFEERTAAVEALLHFHEKILPFELHTLLHSEKTVHKLIGLKLAPMADFAIPMEEILPLLEDGYFEVRQTALHTLGLLYYFDRQYHVSLERVADHYLGDPSHKVQIVALWLKTLLHPQGTEERWLDFLLSSREEERQQACVLIPSLGQKGLQPLLQAFLTSDDPITKVNLAIGLIKQGHQVEEASQVIIEAMNQKNSLWMWKEVLGQRVLSPSNLPATSFQSPPMDVHRLCQLEILQILSLFDKGAAKEGIQKFLRHRNFQVTGIALALLLTEYSEDAAAVVRPLMEDPTYQNRAEACVLMALWSGDCSMTKVMEQLYTSSDRKRKEFLLEAFGKITGTESLPFLVERLGEPYPTLRMIAASSLIQCLNH